MWIPIYFDIFRSSDTVTTATRVSVSVLFFRCRRHVHVCTHVFVVFCARSCYSYRETGQDVAGWYLLYIYYFVYQSVCYYYYYSLCCLCEGITIVDVSSLIDKHWRRLLVFFIFIDDDFPVYVFEVVSLFVYNIICVSVVVALSVKIMIVSAV